MLKLVYCDYIAHAVKRMFNTMSIDVPVIFNVVSVDMDLGVGGEFLSPKRVMRVMDSNGTQYKITIEEDRLWTPVP